MSFINCCNILDFGSLFDLPTLSDSGFDYVKHFQPTIILTNQYFMPISEKLTNDTLSLNLCDKFWWLSEGSWYFKDLNRLTYSLRQIEMIFNNFGG